MVVPPDPTPSVTLPIRPTLVGRDREMGLLRVQLAAACGGQGRLVLVGGEAGIGKTSLVQTIGREAETRGALVLTGHCYDLIATPPYGPWLDLAANHRSGTALPSLPPALAGEIVGQESGGQTALFAQVRDFFIAAAAAQPLVVVLEDLHWADPASLDLLRFLGRQLVAHPILVLATYRADELSRRQPLYTLVPMLVREARAERIELRRLTKVDVRRLVVARYPLPTHAEERLVNYLQAHAEGTPFYLGELLRTIEEEGVLARQGEGWTLGDLSQMRVPTLLRQVIEGRLARLGDDTREVLALAAVIGQEIPLDVWAAVANLPEEELVALISRAVAASILDASGDGSRVRFVHALIRTALYEGVLPPQRRVWHRRVAEALVDVPNPDPDVIASHFQQAGDRRAVQWLVRAGDRAERAFAWLTGAERLEAAIDFSTDDPSGVRDLSWLRYRVGRLRRFADPLRGIGDLEEAEQLGIKLGDAVLAAFARADGGLQRCFMEDMRRGLTEMAHGVDALDRIIADLARDDAAISTSVAGALSDALYDDVPALLRGINPRRGNLAMWRANAGHYVETRGTANDWLSRVAATAPPDAAVANARGDVHFALGIIAAALGRPAEAQAAFADAASLHRTIGNHVMLAFDAGRELMEVHVPYGTTDLARRRRLLADAEPAWTRASGVLASEGPAYLSVAGHLFDLLLVEGRWPDARELIEAARAVGTAQLWRFQVGWQFIVGGVAWLTLQQGHMALARELVRDELPEGPATELGGMQFRQGLLLQRVAVRLALDAGDLPAARAWLAAHDRWLAWSGAVLGRAEGHLLRGIVHRQEGDLDQARRDAETALAAATDPRQPLALLAAQRLAGELATAAGRHVDAERHLTESLMLADACAAPFERALTLLALAELRAAAGRSDAASRILDEVRAICAPLGAMPTLVRADALSARVAEAVTAAVAYPAGLSGREVEVLRLVAEGLTDQEVADRLSISRRTVGQHLRSVYNKLGVPSRAAATRFAVEQGMLSIASRRD